MPRFATRVALATAVVGIVAAAASCSNGVPLGPSTASTTAASTSPAPTPTPAPASGTTVTAAVAYTPDLQPIFDSDCTPCHGGRSPSARYSTATYAGVMAAVRAGSPSSPLLIVTQPGGLMYSFFTGDRATKSALVSRWVFNGAPATR